jgi:hypothetical protein
MTILLLYTFGGVKKNYNQYFCPYKLVIMKG